MKTRILVVEDDINARQKLAYRLQYAGYLVTEAADGEAALDLLETEEFDVVLTDIVMKSVDGIEVLHTARQMDYRPAVILLTGHGSLDTCMDALRAGAYDYLLKPCSPETLLNCVEGAIHRHDAEHQLQEAARILSGHTPGNNDGPTTYQGEHRTLIAPKTTFPLHIGAISIGRTRHNVLFHGEPVHLTPIEYALLFYLAERAGKVCRCSDIVQYTHGMETDDADAQSLLRTHLHNLRKKLDPAYFLNDRGSGYMLVIPQEREGKGGR